MNFAASEKGLGWERICLHNIPLSEQRRFETMFYAYARSHAEKGFSAYEQRCWEYVLSHAPYDFEFSQSDVKTLMRNAYERYTYKVRDFEVEKVASEILCTGITVMEYDTFIECCRRAGVDPYKFGDGDLRWLLRVLNDEG